MFFASGNWVIFSSSCHEEAEEGGRESSEEKILQPFLQSRYSVRTGMEP